MKKEEQLITIRIQYKDEMTVHDLQDSLAILNESFITFYEMKHISLSETNKVSPKITSISEGSLVVEVIIPITCALLPIVYDIIKTKFWGQNKYIVSVCKSRTKWSKQDNYEISKAVLEEYVLKKSKKSIDEFINSLSLGCIYKKGSIRAKIQNTQQLIKENNIPSSLTIAPLSNYSKGHKEQFGKARKDLGV